MRPRHALLQLSSVPHASREARQAAKVVLEDWELPTGLIDDATLVISELVTNAVRHTGNEGMLQLELAQDDAQLRVSLADGSTVEPRLRRPGTRSEDGRGLRILAALSDRWGIEPVPLGKRVWWEVDVPSGYRDATAARATATASA